MYRNWKIKKDDYWADEQLQEEYATVAEWCNNSQENTERTERFHIDEVEENGVSYYMVLCERELTEAELSAQVRSLRDMYLVQYVDPIVTNQLRWAELSEKEQQYYIDYRKYLLNIPQSEDFPHIEVKTLDEWWLAQL